MPELADAIEAAAEAIRQHEFPPDSVWVPQSYAAAAIAAAAPLIEAAARADERAKVAEEIETAFRHWEQGAATRPRVERGGFLNDRDWCLAIIRGGHAGNRPQIDAAGRKPGGGSATKDDHDRQEQRP